MGRPRPATKCFIKILIFYVNEKTVLKYVTRRRSAFVQYNVNECLYPVVTVWALESANLCTMIDFYSLTSTLIIRNDANVDWKENI